MEFLPYVREEFWCYQCNFPTSSRVFRTLVYESPPTNNIRPSVIPCCPGCVADLSRHVVSCVGVIAVILEPCDD